VSAQSTQGRIDAGNFAWRKSAFLVFRDVFRNAGKSRISRFLKIKKISSDLLADLKIREGGLWIRPWTW